MVKDLKVRYTQNSVIHNRQYRTLMDFIDTVSDEELQIANIEAEFFENRIEHFSTLGILKEHCEKITR